MAGAPPTASAVYSMTGFARGSGRAGEALGWVLTIKGVNHRFLDLHFRLPSGVEGLEMHLRRLLKEQLVRGHVEVTLSVERGAKRESQYDAGLVESYLLAFRTAAENHGIPGQPDLNAILALPGIFGSGQGSGPNQEDRAAEMSLLEEAVIGSAGDVLSAFQQMRAEEGAALCLELRTVMGRMAEHVESLAEMHTSVEEEYFARVRERIEGMLGGLVERERLLQEAAVLAEKSDVSEEIARLRMHIAQFVCQIEAGGELGKKLDFLLQEMNREANTLLSKTTGIGGGGMRVTELGLRMKSDIEKAREQVQNIE